MLTSASLHQLYAGSPRRGTPGEPVSIFWINSGTVNSAIKALARSMDGAVISHTRFSANGPLVQSGKAPFEARIRVLTIKSGRRILGLSRAVLLFITGAKPKSALTTTHEKDQLALLCIEYSLEGAHDVGPSVLQNDHDAEEDGDGLGEGLLVKDVRPKVEHLTSTNTYSNTQNIPHEHTFNIKEAIMTFFYD
ncbi:glycoside hydrolase family 3 protein [Moniliophthora roreri]|nr:glycoside hydrolase family 3 protein [Moniliophthora roreri]